MKKTILPLLLFCTITVTAQTFQDIKNSYVLQQYSKAKTDIDKAMQDAAFIAKPEAYILKATIYSTLAYDAMKANPAQSELLTAEADAAFTKYKEKDSYMQLLSDVIYQSGPSNLYMIYYSTGYNYYSQKNWNAALIKISKAVAYSDLLIQKKLMPAAVDTNVLVLAGITAENANKKEEAAIYYSRLADVRIAGEGFESVYRYLTSYYFGKNNMQLFEKYKTLGKSLYPSSAYFGYDKIDFVVGTVTGFEEKFAALQSLLKDEPNNFKANQVLGEIIYDELNMRFEKTGSIGFNQQLETAMLAAFTKAASLQAGFVIPHIYTGDYFINKAVALDKDKTAATDAEKKRQLAAAYGIALFAAKDPYEKVVAMYTAQKDMSKKDKQQYKKAVSYLADIASYKKRTSAAGSPEFIKWDAEEKKWVAAYDAAQ